MLSRNKFDTYRPGGDRFQNKFTLRLDDLEPVDDTEDAPLAIMISTWNRMAQLARALECLARQEFRGFTVYLNDDGSEQPIYDLVSKFSPYLRVKYRKASREAWRSCPSSAYRAFLDGEWIEPETETIAIMHPEMMLPPNGTKLLHYLHGDPTMAECYYPLPSKRKYERSVTPDHNSGTWVTLQALFVDPPRQLIIDSVDWHSGTDNLHKLLGFWGGMGFAGKTNREWANWREGCPWWFVGSARADDELWDVLPITRGHATIDMFMITYRRFAKILDMTPKGVYTYHQSHATSAVSPHGENTEDNLHGKKLGQKRAREAGLI